MFRTIASLFGKRDRLVALSRNHDRRAFVRALGEANVYILGALLNEGLDADTFTSEQFLAEIELATRHLNESESVEPFVYEVAGRRRLPFFSTMKRAETFCREYSRERNRVFPFQTLAVAGAVLGSLASGCDELVLNDKSEASVVLGERDIELLREIWG